MSQGFYGFPNILGLLRGTNLRVLGKAGATAGAGLAGGTTSGAPTSGQFDVGEAVIGADGTLFICTVSGSPGTWVQLGTLVDPLSVRGDLIVRGASATTRLALGTANYVLTSNGTDVVWAVSPAAAGGALTQIASTVLGASAASITFSSISAGYTSLVLMVDGRIDAASSSLLVQLNGDTAANYDWQYIRVSATGSLAGAEGVGSSSIRMTSINGTDAAAGVSTAFEMAFPNYAATTFQKTCHSAASFKFANSTTNIHGDFGGGFWRSTAAITSIKILPGAGNFITGTTAVLWGVS